jgi:hypothetical protein
VQGVTLWLNRIFFDFIYLATMRKSTLFFIYISLMTALLFAAFMHALARQKADLPLLQRNAGLVQRLELTDLCLFTDAQYTRHPAVAVLNTPFQDYPLSFEHFPSGSLSGPPPHLVSHE